MHHETRVVTWHPTKDKEVILNVDGSSFGNQGVTGFGGIFRTKFGDWIQGFARSTGVGDNLLAELMELYHSLRLTQSKVYRDLTCYFDSKNVLLLVTSPSNVWHNYAPIIKNMKDLLDRD